MARYVLAGIVYFCGNLWRGRDLFTVGLEFADASIYRVGYQLRDVDTEQILRVELFGKENYQVRLKSGVCLRASNAGYKLLKERLSL